MSRLPSHGLRFGSPPKLHGQLTVQLQLSATVAVMCQFGAAACGGAMSAVRTSADAATTVRMARHDRLSARSFQHEVSSMRSARTLAVVAACAIAAFAVFPAVQSQAQGGRSPFDALHFRDIGPAATGGRIHDIQIDPADPAVLYVAAATGGIWKSTNKGLTWKDIFGRQPDSA